MNLLNLTTSKSFVASARCLSKHLQGVEMSYVNNLLFLAVVKHSSAPHELLHLEKIVLFVKSFLGFSLSCET